MGQELWVRTATHIFPSTNETDRSCFVKLDLCRKKGTLPKRERDLGDFCPSLCAGKVCGWEKTQGEPQWYCSWCFLLLLLSRDETRGHLGLGRSPISGDAALPPCFLGLLIFLCLFRSVLLSYLCFALSPKLTFLKRRIITV